MTVKISALILTAVLTISARGQMLQSISNNVTHGTCATDYGNGWGLCQQVINRNAGSGSSFTGTLPGATTLGHALLVFSFVCNDTNCSTSGAAISCTLAHGTDTSPESATGSPFRIGSGGRVIFYVWAIPNMGSTSTSVAVTCTGGTPFFVTVGASEWSGGVTSGIFDVANALTGTAATSASVTAGTTTNAVDLVAGMLVTSVSQGITPGAGFTEIGDLGTGLEHEALSVASTGSQSCTWTMGSSVWEGVCATLKHQ